MEITLRDLMIRLATFEETFLLELLEINSVDILDRFEDVVEERMDYLLQELEQMPIPQEEEEQEGENVGD